MELVRGDENLEQLNRELNDEARLQEYAARFDQYRPALLPRVLGRFLIACGNFFYGTKPSYLKFRAIEVIARVPYHSWDSATYTLLTLFYRNEKRAMELSRTTRFSRLAQDNETMHVVVISHLCDSERKGGVVRHTLVPMFFAFFYFWWSYFLYLINKRYSFELNFLFEQHAFEQYSLFLRTRREELKLKEVDSAFLRWYGRAAENQYEFFRSVRNDEIIHRNRSIEEIEELERRTAR